MLELSMGGQILRPQREEQALPRDFAHLVGGMCMLRVSQSHNYSLRQGQANANKKSDEVEWYASP